MAAQQRSLRVPSQGEIGINRAANAAWIEQRDPISRCRQIEENRRANDYASPGSYGSSTDLPLESGDIEAPVVEGQHSIRVLQSERRPGHREIRIHNMNLTFEVRISRLPE